MVALIYVSPFSTDLSKTCSVLHSRPMNPGPGMWRGSDDNGYMSAEPSPGLHHMVSTEFRTIGDSV